MASVTALAAVDVQSGYIHPSIHPSMAQPIKIKMDMFFNSSVGLPGGTSNKNKCLNVSQVEKRSVCLPQSNGWQAEFHDDLIEYLVKDSSHADIHS